MVELSSDKVTNGLLTATLMAKYRAGDVFIPPLTIPPLSVTETEICAIPL